MTDDYEGIYSGGALVLLRSMLLVLALMLLLGGNGSQRFGYK